jgi:FlaA1/EpsC-like NDP-sugar epimerase
MVTGAGGSIGSELCRQIVNLGPASLVMFDRYENGLHAIRIELEDKRSRCGLHPVVGDVTDAARVGDVLREYRPEIVFHAAAHKHVPLMEENPCEAVKNNVRGTRLLAEAAEFHGVDRFILISTDKAVNPTSVMGMSKRIAELAVRAQAEGSGTSFSIVRFGNVLGSNGSVVPRFMEQIKNGGPVTITHPEMRRFFMLIPEAVQLVLHAAAQAESGATYVLEMGEQVKLVDMARDLIRLSGLVPDEDVEISFIGLRPGEKLFEELLCTDEEASPSAVDKILCVRSQNKPQPGLDQRIVHLEEIAREGSTALVVGAMRSITDAPQRRAPESTHTLPLASAAAALADIAVVDSDQQPCRRCESGIVHRSRAKSVTDRIRKTLTAKRPYRCDACHWRGWLTPAQISAAAPVDPDRAFDFESLDVLVGRPEPQSRPSFSPRNL